MKIAVLTLTRERLEYTKHCFETLRANAGCGFDHYVLDQGSTDGTDEWLKMQWAFDSSFRCFYLDENVGIARGMNYLLDHLAEDYDVVVKVDNDCELVQPNTLRDVCQLVVDGGAILSPRILGLRNPPQATRKLTIGRETIWDIPQIGGIFLAVPGWWYDDFRYDESAPPWGGDDVEICRVWREDGGTCGYVERLTAWHYETTDGQHDRYPDYFDARIAAGGPA